MGGREGGRKSCQRAWNEDSNAEPAVLRRAAKGRSGEEDVKQDEKRRSRVIYVTSLTIKNTGAPVIRCARIKAANLNAEAEQSSKAQN
jgi:hypothetical protein